MKKHLFGFAIFSLIVSLAIIVSEIFSSSKEVFVPVVETTYETRVNTSCWKMKQQAANKTFDAPLSYTLEDVSLDAKENILRAKIQIAWHGSGNKPDAVNYKINFFTDDNPGKMISITEDTLQSPFDSAYTVTKTFAVPVKMRSGLFDLKKNYYAYVDLWSFEQNSQGTAGTFSGRMTRVVLNENEKLAKASPVTIFHGK